MSAPAPLLAVEGLTKHFPIREGLFVYRVAGLVRAVDGVSFTIAPGETLGLVGESGCGKSTVGRLILWLIEPTAGEVRFDGRDLVALDRDAMREVRRDVQIIFQDPYGALNPRMSVEQILREPLEIHGQVGDGSARLSVPQLLDLVSLPRTAIDRYPHEFSGGQRQRIGIARALALRPKLIVCDEPVSALDVSIQAQIVNLLQDLQRDFGLAYLFIAHDLGVVKHISDRVAVMYLGKIVETAPKKSLYAMPRHPYSQALLASIPAPRPSLRGARRHLLGEIPSALAPPPGCRFNTRCPHAQDICRRDEPPMTDLGDGHAAACHFVATIPPYIRPEFIARQAATR